MAPMQRAALLIVITFASFPAISFAAGWSNCLPILSIQARTTGDFFIKFDGTPTNPSNCNSTGHFQFTAANASSAGGKVMIASLQMALASGIPARVYSSVCSGNMNSIANIEVGEY